MFVKNINQVWNSTLSDSFNNKLIIDTAAVLLNNILIYNNNYI